MYVAQWVRHRPKMHIWFGSVCRFFTGTSHTSKLDYSAVHFYAAIIVFLFFRPGLRAFVERCRPTVGTVSLVNAGGSSGLKARDCG